MCCDRNIRGIQKPVIWYIVHILIFFIFVATSIGEQNMNNYGSYVIIWETFESCKGPKQGACGKFEITNTQNMSNVIFLFDFPEDCPATMGKIVVTTKNNNVTKKLWNYVLNKPCEHFVMGPVLVKAFNLTKDCKVNKGQYEIHVDFEAIAEKFLGKSFFYGITPLEIRGQANKHFQHLAQWFRSPCRKTFAKYTNIKNNVCSKRANNATLYPGMMLFMSRIS